MTLLLAVDVGNTETVIGGYEVGSGCKAAGEGLRFQFRMSTEARRTADESFLLLSQFLERNGAGDLEEIVGVVISSSALNVTRTIVAMASTWLGIEPLLIAPGIKVGMPIRYENPREVGPDRIADAVAAVALYGSPVVVVDFGTATTFDAISSAGEYLGGAIAPGIEVSLDALVARAAALRKVELVFPRSVIGRSTAESIQAGLMHGVVGQVTGVVNEMKEIVGEATVVATGGLSQTVAPLIPVVDHVEPWLTLFGLRLLWERNGSPGGRCARA